MHLIFVILVSHIYLHDQELNRFVRLIQRNMFCVFSYVITCKIMLIMEEEYQYIFSLLVKDHMIQN